MKIRFAMLVLLALALLGGCRESGDNVPPTIDGLPDQSVQEPAVLPDTVEEDGPSAPADASSRPEPSEAPPAASEAERVPEETIPEETIALQEQEAEPAQQAVPEWYEPFTPPENPQQGGLAPVMEGDAQEPEPEDEPTPGGRARSVEATALSTAKIQEGLLRLINNARSQKGLEPLVTEGAMQFAAEIRAEEALLSLSHTRPDGTPYHTAFDEAGFSYAGRWHGENLAVLRLGVGGNDAVVAAALYEEWEKSPGHEQNLLGEHFAQTGIGVYITQEDDMYQIGAAQLFASA